MQPGLNFLDTDFTKIDFKQIKPNAFFYGADINNGRKFSKMDNAGVITVIEGGGGGGGGLIPITYAALLALVTGATLQPTRYYLITDFQTVYDQPDYDAAGNPKAVVITKTGAVQPIIVFAENNAFLSQNIAFQPAYPLDYIEYNIYFTTTEHMAAPAKGRITKRIDAFSNTADYDSRQVQFIRYESAPASGIFNVVKDNGGATAQLNTFNATNCIFNNTGQNAAIGALAGFAFLLSNNVFGANNIGNNMTEIVQNCTFLDGNTANTLFDSVQFVSLGASNSTNIFGVSCNNLILGDNNGNNIFGIGCIGSFGNGNNTNEFGNGSVINFENDNLNNTFKGNGSITLGNVNETNNFGISNTIIIGNGNSSNTCLVGNTITFGDNNTNINIGNGNTFTCGNSNVSNDVGNSNTLTFTDTSVLNSFEDNCTLTLPTGSSNNKFQSNSSGNTFSAPLLNNNFAKFTLDGVANFAASTHVYAAYTCNTFYNAGLVSPRLSYFDALDVLTVVNINA